MGLIAKILSFTRTIRNAAEQTDVKANPGGGFNLTARHYSAPGDDSHPLPDDYTVLMSLTQTGNVAAVGYADVINTPVAALGEKRIYARDSNGAIVAETHLKNTGEITSFNSNADVTISPDGRIQVNNGSGSIDLQAGGDVIINGVTISSGGDVTIPSSLTLNGKEIAEHTHAQGADSGGDTQVPTGPNL